jgi:hypothetical protein
VSSFRDFIQKLADAGYVNLKQVDRSLLVELKETREEIRKEIQESPVMPVEPSPPEIAAPIEQPSTPVQASEAIRVLQELLRESQSKAHWPMYLRTFKQFLRSLQPPFDERQFGLSSTYDLVRQAHRDGLLRVERNRQGILRIFPVERVPQAAQEQQPEEPLPVETVESEYEIPSPEPEPSLSEPVSQLELPNVLSEIPSEPAVVEESIQIQAERVAEPPDQKQKPKRKRKTSSAGSTKSAKRARQSPLKKNQRMEGQR